MKAAAGTGALAALGDFSFLAQLPRVSAAEAKLPAHMVKLHPDIEPLVRLLENTSRERVLEEVAAKIKRGTTYREVLAAIQLAGVRNIQPRPVGFKFHAVLVVNSAHLASQSSPDIDRWLPIFWAVDAFKSSQAADVKEGDWAMGAIDESAVPPAHKAKQALIDALENWDEAAADPAIVGLCRSAGAHEIFEILCRCGARDYRELGHKEIYTANSFRCLEAIGWQHAEPILRSLVYAMSDRVGDKNVNPAKADLPADRPFRRNLERAKQLRAGWLDGKPDSDATAEMLKAIRDGSAEDTSTTALALLNRGVAPQSIWDALFDGAGELLMRAPGIASLHATTFTNATHYAFQHCRNEETRKLLLLQNSAFLPLFRGNSKDKGLHIDSLEPLALKESGAGAVEEIFADVSGDKLTAFAKDSHLPQRQSRSQTDHRRRAAFDFSQGPRLPRLQIQLSRFGDYQFMAPEVAGSVIWPASCLNLKGSGDKDNDLVQRTRAALST
jgi:hypothetical protein